MDDPVVISGIGVLSALGVGVEETAAALREGAGALAPSERGRPPEGATPLAGEVPPFRLEEFVPSPKAYLDRNSELLLAACGLALRHAGLDPAALAPERSGILVGTAWSGQDTMSAFFADYVQKGPRLVKPFLFPHAYFNTAVSLAAIEWSLRGPHQAFASGRAAAAQALIEAHDLLADGEADVLLAGGCEALGPALVRALAALGWLAPASQTAGPRVFDRRRDGLVPGEAGAVLVFERASRAQARGAPPLAVFRGGAYGAAPDVADAASAACRQALDAAGVAPSDLALVCASANGFGPLDDGEAEALRRVLGGAAVPVCAPAALCGDTQGACAALHAALSLLLRADGRVPPVPGLETPARPGPAFVTGAPAAVRPGPVLVLAADPAGSAAAFVLG
jgi:3-oxoacyl-[acyl-carrier-protein] synthase II